MPQSSGCRSLRRPRKNNDKKNVSEHGEFENTYWQSSEAYFYASDFNYTGEGIENPELIL